MKMQRLKPLLLALLGLVAVGCGDDGPNAPTPVIPSFAGTWAGSSLVQQCTGNATLCAQTNPNMTVPTEFVFTQGGTSVSGTWTVNNVDPRIPVTGSVASDGSLNLSGRLTSGTPASLVVVDNSRLTVAGTAMSGTLTYSVTLPNAQVITVTIGLQGITKR